LDTIEKLTWLVENCVSVTLDCNDHRSIYQSVATYIEEEELYSDPEMSAECVRQDRLYTLHVYPHTPVGFHFAYHYELPTLIDRMYKLCGGP
jgi:hypothetical protein